MESITVRHSFRKSKVLLATFVSLCIVGVALCILVGTVISQRGAITDGDQTNGAEMRRQAELVEAQETDEQAEEMDGSGSQTRPEVKDDLKYSMESSGTMLPQAKRLMLRHSNRMSHRPSRKTRSTDNSDQTNGISKRSTYMDSCVSEPANDTIPAAHIKGRGYKRFGQSTRESAYYRKGYQQKWKCIDFTSHNHHSAHAFVDGGMIFNQTDKSLRVPVCGYYHVSSQVYYTISDDSVNSPASVYHLLKFDRNCSSWSSPYPVMVIGRNMAAGGMDTTTYTSDVVRLCAGGKIWIEIPDGVNNVPCCPIGDEEGTFITAYLVAPTTCHWPPDTKLMNMNQ